MYSDNPNLQSIERELTPLQRILLHPETFTPDKLTVNEVEQGNCLLAKIPQIPNRITRRKKANSDEYYIELVLSQHYDPESKQNRNKKVIIGTDFSYHLKGMMFANDNYHEYFNALGDLLPHVKEMIREDEKRKQQSRKENTPAETQEQTIQPEQQNQPRIPEPVKQEPPEEEGEASEVQIKELRQREEALSLREQQLNQREHQLNQREKQLDNLEMTRLIQLDQSMKDHISLLSSMLNFHINLVDEQAKRRPDKPMSAKQIQTINEVLSVLQNDFRGSESEDYLHLAEEPDEGKNIPGTTYGEMALLLSNYASMLSALPSHKLRMK